VQYHEVKLYFTFASAGSIPGITTSNADWSFNVWADYIFLDTAERTRFAQLPHEYLIEQLQFTGSETATPSASSQVAQNIRLNFNHPTKFITWVLRGNTHGLYTAVPSADNANIKTYNESLAPLLNAKLQLNGQDRFTVRNGSYFNQVQPFQSIGSNVPAGIYLYSFALKPEEHQPSGTCNFSRIDNATLSLTYKQASVTNEDLANLKSELTTYARATSLTQLNIYAKNYNVLRVMSGMAGLAWILFASYYIMQKTVHGRKSQTPRGSGISSWTPSFVPPAVYAH